MTVTTLFICIGSRAPAVLYSGAAAAAGRRQGGRAAAGRQGGGRAGQGRAAAGRGGGRAGRRHTCNVDGYNHRRVGGLWTGGGAPPCAIPRSIALKFSRKSSPICPNTAGCQPSMAVNVPKPEITAIIALSYFSFRA